MRKKAGKRRKIVRFIWFAAAILFFAGAAVYGVGYGKDLFPEICGGIWFVVILFGIGVVCMLIAGVLLEPGPGLLPGIWEENGYGMTEEELKEIRELLDSLDEKGAEDKK